MSRDTTSRQSDETPEETRAFLSFLDRRHTIAPDGASRLSANGAHLWMAGWTTLRVAHAPNHRPSAAHNPIKPFVVRIAVCNSTA